MKKYFAGFIAVCFSFICFAFTSQDTAIGPDCVNSTYWFHVANASTKTDCATIAVADFDPVLDPNQNGAIDPGELNAALLLRTPIQAPYGCPDTNDEVCALSFNSSQITVVLKGDGQYYFEPSTVSAYQCCIKRP